MGDAYCGDVDQLRNGRQDGADKHRHPRHPLQRCDRWDGLGSAHHVDTREHGWPHVGTRTNCCQPPAANYEPIEGPESTTLHLRYAHIVHTLRLPRRGRRARTDRTTE